MANTLKPLSPLPTDFTAQREDLHRLAYAVVAETRRQATGRFGLRPTPGGFGTPEFEGRRVRVEGRDLIIEAGNEVSRTQITSLAEAARFAGVEPGTEASEDDSPPLGDTAAHLQFDAGTVALLGDWYELGDSVMEELAREPGAAEVGEIQLWPGHFDLAIEIGDGDRGRRATYGASPGDADHPGPYFYVGPWSDVDRSDSYWNDSDFGGASITYEAVGNSEDPRATALQFFRDGYRRLHR